MATWGIAKFGRTAGQTVNYIIASTPPYRDVQRSWRALGYLGQGKPTELLFRAHVEQLWTDLNPAQFASEKQSRRAEKARRYILAAIDAIGWYSSPRFSASSICTDLNLTNQDIAARPLGHWAALPNPLTLQEYRQYTRRPAHREDVLRMDQYREHPPRQDAPQHSVDVPDVYRNQWQRYHRYYNFVALAGDFSEVFFRALPVPRNQWSLWHSVAYQVTGTAAQPGNIHGYLDVKAGIWKFFTRHVRDVRSLRWRAFVLMELMSRYTYPLWGELSILRCLHRNEEDAGCPAYPAEGPDRLVAMPAPAGIGSPENLYLLRSILQLISEYYGREVILFYPPAIGIAQAPIPPTNQVAAAGRIDPTKAQDATDYLFMVVGSNTDNYDNQILLVTDDMWHFDPVVFVDGPQGRSFDTSHRFGDRRYLPMPWGDRNYANNPPVTPQQVRALNCPTPLGFVPADRPGFHAAAAPAYLRYFRTKRDIAGLMLNLPTLPWCRQNWNRERNAPNVLALMLQETNVASITPRAGAYQIRHGPIAAGAERPLESQMAHKGASMILEALNSGKDGGLIARSHKFFLEGDFREV